jgi:WhiB family redox-sensing transcriptional regulator
MKTIDAFTSENSALALCAQTDPDLYFPEGTAGSITRSVLSAKAVCFECPLIRACFEMAMTFPMTDDWGVWGGSSRHERTLMRRKPHLLQNHQKQIEEVENANNFKGKVK